VRFVLVPPMNVPLWLTPLARPAWAGVAGLAFAMLPRWARTLYGPAVPVLPGAELATTAAGRALRATLMALPADRREGPHLKAARARLDSAA
jgi:hypothetical protein